MPGIGIANTITGSNLVGQVQGAQNLAVDVNQKNVEAHAAREQQQRTSTVTTSKDNEKVRERKRREEQRRRKNQGAQMQGQDENANDLEAEDQPPTGYKRIDVTV